MLENRLFDRHHGAIGRYQRPTISSVPDKKSELGNHYLRSCLVHLDRKIVLQFRRTHVIARTISPIVFRHSVICTPSPPELVSRLSLIYRICHLLPNDKRAGRGTSCLCWHNEVGSVSHFTVGHPLSDLWLPIELLDKSFAHHFVDQCVVGKRLQRHALFSHEI